MARLLGIRIQNYKSLQKVELGQVEYAKGDPLPRFACFIGPNGSGKSTLLDAFGFVADCLLEGVEAACDKPHRGGFEALRTQGTAEPIEFEIFFDAEDGTHPIVYAFQISGSDGVPRLTAETLRQRRRGETRGKPYYFLKLKQGQGKVWDGELVEGEDDAKAARIQLDDLNRMALATLGNLTSHPRIVKLRTYIEQWYLSYFLPDAARELPPAGAQPRLNRDGSNVGNVLQHFQRRPKAEFEAIIERVRKSIPGVKGITPLKSHDGRLLLRFDEAGFRDPFYQRSMSDGTLKMLAYAVLLADPAPRPFIGIEEPENGLYVELIEHLASLFVGHTTRRGASTQMFVTTHSPYFVNALQPEQVWLMQKREGRSIPLRVRGIPVVDELTQRGVPLGSQWYSRHFEATPAPRQRPQ
jgi:predicted ATPase